ncbi:hypothetical protein TL16_g05219 [Triparma laevis f. inornata]|uniref:Uncharacterized protein n=1 Tax=Triparma laevis f. inornata TaxID=1714386 RepID=A0A9W7AIB0_9STRA|nr:hypothetical protein TL16_g05219 [Triparma laevis f. inornata]
MSYQGLSEESTLILPFTTYLGMAGVIILPERFFGETLTSSKKPKKDRDPPTSPSESVDPELTVNTLPSTNTQHRHTRALSSSADQQIESQTLLPQPSRPSRPKKTTAQLPPFCLRLGTRGILFLMILADFGGTSFSLIGMQLCGSGLHTVVMSSTVCWAAILSYFILSKKVSGVEAGSLIVIMVGLLFSASAQKHMGVVKVRRRAKRDEDECPRREAMS